MGEGFKRFKLRIMLNTLLRSTLYGASFGIACSAVAIILAKILEKNIQTWLYILLGIGGMLVCGTVMFLILYQNDKKIARRLDKKLHLRERVKTMHEFQDDESGMAALQRADTDEKLRAASVKGFLFRRVWICLVTLAVASALLTVGILIPEKQPPEPVDPDFDMTDYQSVALQNLIKYVRESDMDAAPKYDVVEVLRGLLEELKTAEKESQKKELVITAINSVIGIVDGACAYDEIGEIMRNSGHESMKIFDEALVEAVDGSTTNNLNTLRDKFREGLLSDIEAGLERFANEINPSLADSDSDVSVPLYAAILNFKNSVKILSDNMGSSFYDYTPEQVQEELDVMFATLAEALHPAMLSENNNSTVGNYTVDELMRIFGISEADLSDEVKDEIKEPPVSEDEGKKEDDDITDGGIGTGELIYGSNELIYSPDHEAQVNYGVVMDDYAKDIYEILFDGNISDEMQDFINAYLDMLIDGTKRED